MKKFRQILKDIRSGKVAPVYFLCGEEIYFAKKIEETLLQTVVPPEAKTFDEAVLYAPDMSLDDFLLRAGAFPMLSDKQLLVARQAQHFFKKQEALERVKNYLSRKVSSTVLVFRYDGKPGVKIKNVFQKDNETVYYEAPKLYENRMGEILSEIFAGKKFTLNPKSQMMLLEYIGTDLARMEKEAEKLSVVFPEGGTLTPEIIEEYIGISKDYNFFELKSAIARGDVKKAVKIASVFSKNPKEYALIPVIAMLYNFFVQLYQYHTLPDKNNRSAVASALKINPYFIDEYRVAARIYPMKKVSRNMRTLKEIDLKLKGFGSQHETYRDLLNDLIYQIMLRP